MTDQTSSRRTFLKQTALVGGSAAVAAWTAGRAPAAQTKTLHLATNQYPWFTFYRRRGKDFNASLDHGIESVAGAGLDGFEPLAVSVADVDRLVPLLQKHGLEMRSLYVNSTLHVKDQIAKSFQQVLAIAEKAKAAGTRIIVTNPSPIRWGGPENKTDTQLKVQAKALDRLGRELKSRGLTLAYHNHDIELRNAAREFHHMMLATDPENVTFCLDAHWIFRGSGDSCVALFDVLKLYGRRVTELHLRQSAGGVWTEAFGPGDIDYPALAAYLLEIGVRPHLVLEQAVEKDSPDTMDAVEAHRKGAAYARTVFAAFAG